MGVFHGTVVNTTNFGKLYYSENTGTAENILLSCYTTTVFIFGMIGNGLVIIGTIRYKATRYDRVTILFVKYLAISDLLAMIIYVLPTVMVHLSKGWLFGEDFCYFLGLMNILPGFLHTTFILLISLHRLGRCVRKVNFWVDRKITIPIANIISVVVFGMALCVPAYYYFTKTQIVFHISNCCTGEDANPGFPLKSFLKIIHAIEYTLIVGSVMCIAGIASTMGHNTWRSHRRIILTTFAIVAVYLLSWTPLLYSWITLADPHHSTLLSIPDTVYKAVVYGFFVSLVANPLIYTYINKHFKVFLEEEIRSSVKSFSSIVMGGMARRNTRVEVNSDSLVEVAPDEDEGVGESAFGPTRNTSVAATPIAIAMTRRQARLNGEVLSKK